MGLKHPGTPIVRIKALQDLGGLREQLRQAEAEATARREREAAEAAAREAERQLFSRSVGPVKRTAPPAKVELAPPQPAPEPRQRQLDEAAALKAALSDDVDLESLLLTDDGLSFRRPNIGVDVLARLRKGHWAIQGQLDLHGLRRDEAREELAGFIRRAHQQSHRCLRVVHGKGNGSPGKTPVLKDKVQRWLAQRQEVIAFAQASGPQGGAGALIVLLSGRSR